MPPRAPALPRVHHSCRLLLLLGLTPHLFSFLRFRLASQEGHQLNAIFDMLGTPSPEDLADVQSPVQRRAATRNGFSPQNQDLGTAAVAFCTVSAPTCLLHGFLGGLQLETFPSSRMEHKPCPKATAHRCAGTVRVSHAQDTRCWGAPSPTRHDHVSCGLVFSMRGDQVPCDEYLAARNGALTRNDRLLTGAAALPHELGLQAPQGSQGAEVQVRLPARHSDRVPRLQQRGPQSHTVLLASPSPSLPQTQDRRAAAAPFCAVLSYPPPASFLTHGFLGLRRYKSAPDDGLALLGGMLQFNPNKRLNLREAMVRPALPCPHK